MNETAIVECIPNFSEGLRKDVIAAIRDSIQSPGVALLDQHSDRDHNRTVFTFVGSPDAVSQACFQAVKTASELIDLDHHHGEHPRLGATDVVPFVPISGVTMEDCIQLARDLGARVGEQLGIPVYLYENAATRPERVKLEDVRRGEYEGLKETIATDPARLPDFGPARLGPAGATVIGARFPLIAFNVYLDTDDQALAKAIARKVRTSSGGLPHVKALGLLVEGLAQVSMNLTNYTITPVARVVSEIRALAEEASTQIHHSELVGLIPQEALIGVAEWHLKLKDFTSDQVLENRLFAALGGEETETFLERIAAGTPSPGGGSAAAYAGALGAGLVAMVARLTLDRKKYAPVALEMEQILEEAETLRRELSAAVEDDAAAFEAVMTAIRLPKASDSEIAKRSEAIEQATVVASEVPLDVAHNSKRVLEMALETTRIGNLNAITDAAVGGRLAATAVHSASLNVRINLQSLKDKIAAERFDSEIRSLEAEVEEILGQLDEVLRERGGL